KTLLRQYEGRKLFAYEIITAVGLTLFPVVIIPAIITQSRLMPDMLFYLAKSAEQPCTDYSHVIAYLNNDAKIKNATVMAPMDYTPEFMLYTPADNYITAPYHRNDRGIVDSAMFFRSYGDDFGARRIAKKLNLDYVLMCKSSSFQSTLEHEPARP